MVVPLRPSSRFAGVRGVGKYCRRRFARSLRSLQPSLQFERGRLHSSAKHWSVNHAVVEQRMRAEEAGRARPSPAPDQTARGAAALANSARISARATTVVGTTEVRAGARIDAARNRHAVAKRRPGSRRSSNRHAICTEPPLDRSAHKSRTKSFSAGVRTTVPSVHSR